ncbi:uncharacterized protein LOC126560775 [Anopheles maculipalpis]|uniref:uncharacterized protein LOC126560775 n=1 Tax=Anopheles maculipalpis TaxID=1496333 RepID=UPI0021591057|nr:uncharacterized protein LOC126560775 [Anopheles maculipalpis]
MANKASTDGVDFQRQLLSYIVGLVHDKYEYSIMYEGNDQIYGAMDDVILKINPNANAEDSVNRGGLYFFQAKQKQDVTYTRSIQDLLHDKKDNIEKYITTYSMYKKSLARKLDGMPTKMIYWTSNDFHQTTKEFLEQYATTEPHLALTIESISKYSIKHWKALFMFDIAQNLACHAGSSKKKIDPKPFNYLNGSIAKALAHEILVPVEESTLTENQEATPKVKFRAAFLQDAPSLSENAKQFRKSFNIACKMLYTNPNNPTFDINSLSSKTFSTNAFSVGTTNTSPEPFSFAYKGLEEEELDWFFEHFVFYVKIPKGERMIKAIQDLLNDRFNREMFEKYLVTEPQRLQTLAEKDKNLQQPDGFLSKSYVQSVMDMIELKRKLTVQPPKGIIFKKENIEQLEDKIISFFAANSNCRSLVVVSTSMVEWTAARIREKFEQSLVVSNGPDFQQLVEALNAIQYVPFGGCLINGEVKYIILLDLPDIDDCSRRIVQQLAGVKVIEIVRIAANNLCTVLIDEIELGDVEVDPEQVEIKHVAIDEKKIVIAKYLKANIIDSVKKIEELSTLTDIIVKSEVYKPDEEHYIKRNFIAAGGEIITERESLLTSAVSIICGTSGHGKTMELLQITELTQTSDGIVCLYLRANTIAKSIIQASNVSSRDGFDLLLKLLNITPDTENEVVLAIVKQCLEQMQTVCLLVDGFDEIVEKYEEIVVKFLQKMLQYGNCRLVIATRDESVPVLKKAFKKASFYTLASFSYETYFRQLWLSDPNELTPDLEQNVEIFLTKFDQLLKGAGWKSFLEVPQLCKIMGTIYHDRIRKPNIQWHTNYEVGSIYDTFVESKLENTLRGRFDEMDKLHVWASELIRKEYYMKHAQLAYELEYNCYSDLKYCEQLQRFGLMMIQYDSSRSVNFMHRTVMDYFLVRYCLLEDIGKEEFHYFLKRYFCVSRANIADKFIDFFMHDTDYLSANKKEIIRSYLYSGILPMCIRMALNNATFNTLRLLLLVAPKELLTQLCFRFGASSSLQGKKLNTNNSNDINLKRLGEKQTILLLETLKACDDEYADDYDQEIEYHSILQRMLFEANPDEEDTLEVAIRKPFPEVFDWVVAYCTAHYTPETKRYLIDRMPRYARAMIRHCYAENKEQIIDKLLALCQDTFPIESVRQCLHSFDLLEELIVSIEIVSQGKVFKEDDRLDLTQKILSLLERYGCQETLAAMKQKSKEKVESLQNESIKSMLKQWMEVG